MEGAPIRSSIGIDASLLLGPSRSHGSSSLEEVESGDVRVSLSITVAEVGAGGKSSTVFVDLEKDWTVFLWVTVGGLHEYGTGGHVVRRCLVSIQAV